MALNSYSGSDRSQLIAGLAEAMGVTENIDIQNSSSHYDEVTGTYYYAVAYNAINLLQSTMEN